MILNISIAFVVVYFIYRFFIRCKLYGHKWDASFVLTRDCKCCYKRQVLLIGKGYID